MTVLIEWDAKSYMLGYRDGVERAAEQCRFYAKQVNAVEDEMAVAETLEQLILMLRDIERETVEAVGKKIGDAMWKDTK